ncbi:hypothetical protein GE21DRAFT_9562 [Neurospora crassa]|uniref:Uncharacterized protein n=1 Tax=Neurospora crassa (strain ATCC 24698 / 74-OR23-1A / CBS 708.71 / DSM 1257 / FGSC 987) TaxID=367110 RepID=Q7RX45_NEUCR|nr:hypothetical protein NCU05043 [Neurospora crassa OR74A]EAA27115.1 hypothetical protein NCU05043 [Neurospora crassa OR74A]KHE83826.1 hypothetical protein GE21DRAFT_9562 [Neurospora crassa]|eukprot:XP_956351.1 hypothetical protein NCU05043 [Neurospora crassa OR74A]
MQLSFIFSGLLPGLLLLPSFCLSQDVPFDVDGGLEGCTITDTGTYNSGGTISVAGWTIKVPQNTQVGFPAAWVSWREFCADIAFMKGFEVTVVGNSIPLHGPTAGQIFISQFSTSFGRGLISSISYDDDGSIQLSQGPKLRINDPHGVYSIGYTSHPFWTADDENPSISSFSGFPMCVPRNGSDPLCPMTNRPTLGGSSSKQGTFTAPDPMVMAPFVPGDFVEYAGVWVAGGEMLVYELVATNVQILTPASFPAFIRMEDVLIGVYSGDVNAEVAQTRFIGYTSAASGTSSLTIHAVTGFDVCTGNITTRPVSGGSLIAGQVRNKFRTGITSVAGDVYAREYVILSTTNPVRTKNGILAGQYIQPVTEWIQPELTTPGLPPIPNDFSAMEHLVKGLGRDEEGHVWGPLDPFPQSGVMVSAPAPVVNECPPPPVPSPTTTTIPSNDDPQPQPTTVPPSPPSTTTITPPATTKDIINIISATWISSGSGTLTVTCTSSNTTNTAVGMLLDTPVQMGLVMTGSTSNPGTWTFSSVKIKQVASVTCRSKLGGSATGQVVGKGKRDGDGNGDGEGIERRRWTVGRRGVRRRGGVGSGVM